MTVENVERVHHHTKENTVLLDACSLLRNPGPIRV